MSFFTQSVDRVVADITAKIEQLHAVAAAHDEAAKVHEKIITESNKARAFLAGEYLRAKALAEKLAAAVEK